MKPSPRSLSRRPALVVALLFGLGAPGAVAPASARLLTVTTDPAGVATWDQPTRLVVQGVSATACGAAAVHLALAFSQPTPGRYAAELDESCSAAGPVRAEPFVVSVALPTLAPRSYSFAVRDTDGTFTPGTLDVFSPGTAVVEPMQVVASDAPARLRIRGYGCPIDGVAKVEGHAITLSFTSSCEGSFPQPHPHLFALEEAVGPLAEGEYSVLAFDNNPFAPALSRATLLVTPPAACVPGDSVLCLGGRRFAVAATWRDFDGHTGLAHALVPTGNDGSGLLWFFGPGNAELTVKAIKGCPLNGHWWLFLAAGSNVQYEVTVTDTVSGAQRRYANPLGTLAPLVTDTEAFDCNEALSSYGG